MENITLHTSAAVVAYDAACRAANYIPTASSKLPHLLGANAGTVHVCLSTSSVHKRIEIPLADGTAWSTFLNTIKQGLQPELGNKVGLLSKGCINAIKEVADWLPHTGARCTSSTRTVL
jgi:hypothetical protein